MAFSNSNSNNEFTKLNHCIDTTQKHGEISDDDAETLTFFLELVKEALVSRTMTNSWSNVHYDKKCWSQWRKWKWWTIDEVDRISRVTLKKKTNSLTSIQQVPSFREPNMQNHNELGQIGIGIVSDIIREPQIGTCSSFTRACVRDFPGIRCILHDCAITKGFNSCMKCPKWANPENPCHLEKVSRHYCPAIFRLRNRTPWLGTFSLQSYANLRNGSIPLKILWNLCWISIPEIYIKSHIDHFTCNQYPKLSRPLWWIPTHWRSVMWWSSSRSETGYGTLYPVSFQFFTGDSCFEWSLRNKIQGKDHEY